SLVISRSSTLAAILAPDRRLRSEHHFGGEAPEPGYGNRQTLVVTPLAVFLRPNSQDAFLGSEAT
ncbi:MAG TPA: hypothetical protein VGI17_16455, partial [Solirubrobacterales bacterium]